MKMSAYKKKLPKKASTLIQHALNDLRAIEKQKKTYALQMLSWHEPLPESKKCAVCFAGSVMAETLKVPPNKKAVPGTKKFGVYNTKRLQSLNSFREGYVSDGLYGMDAITYEQYDNVTMFDRQIADYDEFPGQFKRDMGKLARDLKKAGY
jgi:hypothetical protein